MGTATTKALRQRQVSQEPGTAEAPVARVQRGSGGVHGGWRGSQDQIMQALEDLVRTLGFIPSGWRVVSKNVVRSDPGF